MYAGFGDCEEGKQMKTKQTVAKITREILQDYPKRLLFTLQDDITRSGLMYDIAKVLGYWPGKYAVKKAMDRFVRSGKINIICVNTVKSIYQKK